jgi:hypothetical protein
MMMMMMMPLLLLLLMAYRWQRDEHGQVRSRQGTTHDLPKTRPDCVRSVTLAIPGDVSCLHGKHYLNFGC